MCSLSPTTADVLSGLGVGWKKARGGQTKTFNQSIKPLTNERSRCGLLGWGSCAYRNQWSNFE